MKYYVTGEQMYYRKATSDDEGVYADDAHHTSETIGT